MPLSNKDEAEVQAIKTMLDRCDDQLTTMLGNIPSAYVYVVDEEGTILYANTKFAKAMEVENEKELIGKCLYSIIDSSLVEQRKAQNKNSIENEESVVIAPDTFTRKNGKVDQVATQKQFTMVLNKKAVITISAVLHSVPASTPLVQPEKRNADDIRESVDNKRLKEDNHYARAPDAKAEDDIASKEDTHVTEDGAGDTITDVKSVKANDGNESKDSDANGDNIVGGDNE
eukprot:CFRG6929T1